MQHNDVIFCPMCKTSVPHGAIVCTGCQAEIAYGNIFTTLIDILIATFFFSIICVVLIMLGLEAIGVDSPQVANFLHLPDNASGKLTGVKYIAIFSIVLSIILWIRTIRKPGYMKPIKFKRLKNT